MSANLPEDMESFKAVNKAGVHAGILMGVGAPIAIVWLVIYVGS